MSTAERVESPLLGLNHSLPYDGSVGFHPPPLLRTLEILFPSLEGGVGVTMTKPLALERHWLLLFCLQKMISVTDFREWFNSVHCTSHATPQ